MILFLFLLFTTIPIVEIYLLITVGKVIGGFETIWIVLITGILGAWAAKTQGQMVWTDLQSRMQRGEMPADTMLQGVLVFVGGVLLITPGFITDVFGLSLVMPPFRFFYVYLAKNWIAKKIKMGQFHVYTNNSEGFSQSYGPHQARDVSPDQVKGSDNVIDIHPNSED